MGNTTKQPTPSGINLRELTALAVFAAVMIALQVALSALPNMELVTLFVILATLHMGKKALLSVGVFVLAEGLIYGFGIWWFNYLYIWPLLVLIVLLLRRWSHPLLWVVVAGLYGLLFGTLCSLPYFITGGFGAGIGYIVAGLSFDITHCIGNIVLVAVLYYPLDLVLRKVLAK